MKRCTGLETGMFLRAADDILQLRSVVHGARTAEGKAIKARQGTKCCPDMSAEINVISVISEIGRLGLLSLPAVMQLYANNLFSIYSGPNGHGAKWGLDCQFCAKLPCGFVAATDTRLSYVPWIHLSRSKSNKTNK